MYQISFFLQFCGIVLILTYITYAGYACAKFVDNPVETYTLAKVNVPNISEVDTTIYTQDMSAQNKIRFYATVFGIDKNTALRIADCESGFDPKAENVNGSATGVYQFKRKTWKNYCSGDVYNADHNIICFMQLYPKHPDWWECR